MRHDLYQIESLLTARTPAALGDAMVRLSDRLGYASLFYSPLIVAPGGGGGLFHDERVVPPERLVLKNIYTTYPSDWLLRYQQANYVDVDPIVPAAMRGNLPILWRQFTAGGATDPVFDEARQHGLANGLTIPVHGADGEKAVLCASSSEAPELRLGHEAQMVGQLYLSAFYFHEAALALQAAAAPAPPALTQREQECLLWVAHGKTAWETGHILSIAERTVVFHLNNAKRKLGATNRHQAIATAIQHKIIRP